MLNALALGARELAGLPTPQISPPKPSFPSRLLPLSAHRRYYTADDEEDAGVQIRGLVESISNRAIDSGREGAEERVPEIVRERQLTVRLNQGGKGGAIVDLDKESSIPPKNPPSSSKEAANSFNQVAAEYFILPFVSKFWDYLQDTLTREERSRRTSRTGEAGFKAAGTAMILSPLVLSHFINTMSIMVHASRHSPAFLSVVAPAVLELAVTLGTRKMSSEPTNHSPLNPISNEDSKRSASVLSASLELAIVILDASIDLDAGKTLALEHGSLVSGTMLWAQKAFSMLDGGLQLEGMGGNEEMRLRRASAGLVLKVEEITRKWSQAMLLPF
jgi:telomere length regulation protein